jgi:hypothetical protein
LNILLSKEALLKLDLLKQMGGFSSRGRTIEEAVFAVGDIMEYLVLILPTQRDQAASEQALRNFAMLTMMRLGKLGFAKLFSGFQKFLQSQQTGLDSKRMQS